MIDLAVTRQSFHQRLFSRIFFGVGVEQRVREHEHIMAAEVTVGLFARD